MNYASYYDTPKKPRRLGKYLGIGLFTAGAVFLFDPFISVVDLLPDALGYLLMLVGLYRLSDLDERLAEACKGLRYLALIGVARLVSLFLTFGLVSPNEQPVFVLLILFTLGVLDCIILIPMWKNFFGGILYLGSRNDATTMFDREGRGGSTRRRNAAERYTAYTVAFFVLREVLAVLPELTVLSHEKGGVEMGDATPFYDFIGLYRMLGSGIALILGVIWLIMTVGFIRKLKKDTPFFEALTHKYRTEVLTRGDLFARRAVKSSLVCLLVAAVFALDVYLDHVNVLPDILAALFLILSVVFLRRYAGKNLPALLAASFYGVISAVSWYLQVTGYFNQGDLSLVLRSDDIHACWQNVLALESAAAALFVVAVIFILRSLYTLSKRYTGVRVFRDDLSPTYATERTEAIHSLIRKKLIIVGVFAGMTALSTVLWWGVIPIIPELDLAAVGGSAQTQNTLDTLLATAYQFLSEGYRFIDLTIGALWIGVIGSAIGEISEQMEYASMMRD